jgi:AcrR family transcriptional regulator
MPRDTRSLLVAEAAKLLDAGGPAAVTLRDVGKRAGVSHNAPYKHFKSKEDLLAAIASRELDRQSKAMSTVGSGRRPLEALRALMHGYVRWARGHPSGSGLPSAHGATIRRNSARQRRARAHG